MDWKGAAFPPRRINHPLNFLFLGEISQQVEEARKMYPAFEVDRNNPGRGKLVRTRKN
jgi:hypothetical protein